MALLPKGSEASLIIIDESLPQKTLVKVDARRRVTLGRFPSVKVGASYLIRTEPDGTIIMEPAVATNLAGQIIAISGQDDLDGPIANVFGPKWSKS